MTIAALSDPDGAAMVCWVTSKIGLLPCNKRTLQENDATFEKNDATFEKNDALFEKNDALF